jgi:hypothetical protein
MSNPTNLPPSIADQLQQARANIPQKRHSIPPDGSVISTFDSAILHLNDWAFLQGYGYVSASGSATERRWRYNCVFHSRGEKTTQNSRKTLEEDRVRVNTHTRGIGCPVGITITQSVILITWKSSTKTYNRPKNLGGMFILRHRNLDQHNHPPTPNPLTLEPHRTRTPGRVEAIEIAKTLRGVASYGESKEILERMGLEIDQKAFYNLRVKEDTRSLNPYEEAQYILYTLAQEDVHVAVKERYILDRFGSKTDRVIECIAWWNTQQVQLARRFISGFLAQTDSTFNTNEKRLLLQCFIGIDNTGKTFQFLQAFSTAESSSIIRFLLDVLKDHFFYDCPGFAVLLGDFGSGLSAGFALKAAQDTKDAEAARSRETIQKGKQIQHESSPYELQIENYPLPTAPTRPDYEPDSQTIIVDTDWPRAVPPTVQGVNQMAVTLQYCTWHAVEAIKRKLVHSGYQKERRNKIIGLIWKWIEAPTIDQLESARETLILALNQNEKEYLTGYYQPKEPQFCKAYTRQYLNLGSYATQRIEKNHHVVSKNLHKNLRVSEAILRICKAINSLNSAHEKRLTPSRNTLPRLFDREFFSLVSRRITLFCLELCSGELAEAKKLFDSMESDEFNPEIGCQEGCSLPLQYRLPCRHWMLYFYLKYEPIPLNLFHPRWLIDSPSVLRSNWQIRLDNHDYSKGEPTQANDTGDRLIGGGEQLIIDTALELVEKHKNLPLGEKEAFALAFGKMCDSLVTQFDQKLQRLQELPRRLPDAILQPKLSYLPGRKRALTGRETAELLEFESARERRRALRQAEIQARNDEIQVQHAEELFQTQDQRVNEYISRPISPETELETTLEPAAIDTIASTPPAYIPSSQPRQPSHISISSEDNDIETFENEVPPTLAIEPTEPSENEVTATARTESESSEEFLDIDELVRYELSQRIEQLQHQESAPRPSSSRPIRERKPTAKQASQNRREREKQSKKKAQKKKVDTTQLQDYELPIRSSQ